MAEIDSASGKDVSGGDSNFQRRRDEIGDGREVPESVAREAEKEIGKSQEMAAMVAGLVDEARGWSVPEAQARAKADIGSYREAMTLGDKGTGEAHYMLTDMQKRAAANEAYRGALSELSAEVAERVSSHDPAGQTVVVNAAGGQATPEREASEIARRLLAEQNERDASAAQQASELERRRRADALAVEQEAQQANAATVERQGGELDREEFIMPRRITQNYAEVDGKFYAKDGNRLMFQDQGDKLATSTTDKATIADMVALAKAKQWESLKLSGSQEFRREVWLQAESQGIKTQGYTPRESDLAALKALTAERSTNLIAPVVDRAKERAPVAAAPRHDLAKNQATIAAGVQQRMTGNLQALRGNPAFEKFSAEDLAKVAFYRGVLMEREKDAPPSVQEQALAEFDRTMENPAKVRELPRVELATEERAEDRSKAREDSRERDEEELSR